MIALIGIWLIGWVFTISFLQGGEVIHPNPKAVYLGEKLLVVLILIVVWPAPLGYYMGQHHEREARDG